MRFVYNFGTIKHIGQWAKICQNWPIIFALHLRIVPRKGDIILNFRDGLNLTLQNRGIDSDTATVSDLYFDRPYSQFGFGVKENDTVLDIGANVGIYSTYLASHLNQVKIYAFEASPKNFGYLKHNIDHNHYHHKVTYFNQAVAGHKGKIKLYLHDLGSGSHSIYQSEVISNHQKFIEVPATTLKDIFQENKIDRVNFLKLDCEGSEYEIIFNTPAEYLSRIDTIAMELHQVPQYSVSKMKEFLRDHGFKIKRGNYRIIFAYR